MIRYYFNQADPRWANHPYTCDVAGYRDKTIKSSGCGVTCGAMIISSAKEIIYPDAMGDIAMANGYRVPGGTADGFFTYICNRWGLEIERIHSSYDAFDKCKNGYFVVMCAGPGLWTTGGHFILAVGTRGDEIQIFDPYLYAGKFNTSSRRGAGVSVEGTSCYVQIDKFKQYSNIQRLFAIKVGNVEPEPAPAPTPSTGHKVGDVVTINGVFTSSNSTKKLTPLVKTGTITYIADGAPNPYLLNNGNIGWTNDSCIVNGDASAPQPTPTYKTGTVRVNSSLNVRSGPSTGYGVVGSLHNGDNVTIYEEENGWYKIGDSRWVSAQYVVVGGSTPTPQPVTKTMYVKVNSSLNVRSGPSTNNSIVGSLSNGTKVTVYEERNGWARIGDGRWVSAQYLTSSGSSSRPSTVGQTKVLKSATTLYSTPNLGGTRYSYLAGTSVKILENTSSTVDKIYVPKTGRTAYCRNNVYK